MLNVKIDILELIDLQTALRRANRYTEEILEWARQRELEQSIEVWNRDIKNFNALHQKLNAAFDAAYPPPSNRETAA